MASTLGLLLLFVCYCAASSVVRPTKMWRFLGENEEPVLQKFRETLDEFSVGTIKCLRYCIETRFAKLDEPRFFEAIWKLGSSSLDTGSAAETNDKYSTPEIFAGESIKTNGSQKCTFSVVTGCETPTNVELNKLERAFMSSLEPIVKNYDEKSLNFLNDKLVDKSVPANETEISFHVQPNQAEVNVIVLGNVSKIDLKIPLGKKGDSTTTRLTLSSSVNTMHQQRGLRLNVLNPPPGGWSILVEGMNENYRVVVNSGMVPEFEIEADSTKKEPGISSRQMNINYNQMDMNDESSMDQQYMMGTLYDDESPDIINEQKPFQFPSSDHFQPLNNITTRFGADQLEDRILTDHQRTLSDGNFNSLGSQELPLRKYLTVELSQNSDLIASPGTAHRLTFDITNNFMVRVKHYLYLNSQPLRGRIYPVNQQFPPNVAIIEPGQTVSVIAEIFTPLPLTDSTVYKVSLMVQGVSRVEKTVNLYVRAPGSRVYDDTKPWLNYYFNNNCNGRTSAEKCSKSYWSVDVTVQDSDSGLKSISSTPNGIYPYTEFISGTTSPVYFYYSSTCCNRVMRVSATDLSGNVYTQEIDVGVWYNLSGGEITAIVLGVLLLILLIVLIVLSILYCQQKRSMDLPYSQRYGSRASPRSTTE